MSEPQRARYVGWDPGKQPTKSDQRKLKDLYNGSIVQVEYQSQAIQAQKPSFVAAAARLAAAKAQAPGNAPSQVPIMQSSVQSLQQSRLAASPRGHTRQNSASAAAAAFVAPANKSRPTGAPRIDAARPASTIGLENYAISPLVARPDSRRSRNISSAGLAVPASALRLSTSSSSDDPTGIARSAASAALTEQSPPFNRPASCSISSVSSANLATGSPAPGLPTSQSTIGSLLSPTAAGAATMALRSRQSSIITESDFEASFSSRDRDEASAAAMFAAPLSLGQEFSETAVGVPTTRDRLSSIGTLGCAFEPVAPSCSSTLEFPQLPPSPHRSSPPSQLAAPKTPKTPKTPSTPVRSAQASAAARASSLRPIQVAPREPLSVKFVSSLSASLKTQLESKNAIEAEEKSKTQRERNMVIEQTAARISASREMDWHDTNSMSSASTNPTGARSALAAAVRATPRAETEVARIQEVVAARSRRKKRFRPSGQWSSGRTMVQTPRPLSMSERPPLVSRWSTSTAPASSRADTPPPVESATSSSEPSSAASKACSSSVPVPPSPTKRQNFFSKLFRKGERPNSSEVSLMTIEATPSPVQQPAAPPTKHLKQTMRDSHVSKKKLFNEEKPWKHHLEAHVISEKERKRYERVWAANKGTHVPYLLSIVEAESQGALPAGLGDPEGYRSSQSLLSTASAPVPAATLIPSSGSATTSLTIPAAAVAANTATNNVALALSPAASSFSPPAGPQGRQSFDGRSIQSGDTLEMYERQQLEDIHGYAVAQLWRRSHLSDDVLAQVWDLVDNNQDGTLDRSSFVVGMWLVDQCLYGRKLPSRIDDAVWKSVGHLQVKIRVKKPRKKLLKVKYLRHRKRASAATSVDPYLLLSQAPESPRNTFIDA